MKVLGNFQCQGLLIWIIEGQGPTVLAVGVSGGLLGYFFSFFSISLLLSPCLWEMAQYRLKYCTRAVTPKTNNQPN